MTQSQKNSWRREKMADKKILLDSRKFEESLQQQFDTTEKPSLEKISAIARKCGTIIEKQTPNPGYYHLTETGNKTASELDKIIVFSKKREKEIIQSVFAHYKKGCLEEKDFYEGMLFYSELIPEFSFKMSVEKEKIEKIKQHYDKFKNISFGNLVLGLAFTYSLHWINKYNGSILTKQTNGSITLTKG